MGGSPSTPRAYRPVRDCCSGDSEGVREMAFASLRSLIPIIRVVPESTSCGSCPPHCLKVRRRVQLGLELECIPVNIVQGAARSPGFEARKPDGLVPALVDSEFVLWEFNAISAVAFEVRRRPEQAAEQQAVCGRHSADPRRSHARVVADVREGGPPPAVGVPEHRGLVRTHHRVRRSVKEHAVRERRAFTGRWVCPVAAEVEIHLSLIGRESRNLFISCRVEPSERTGGSHAPWARTSRARRPLAPWRRAAGGRRAASRLRRSRTQREPRRASQPRHVARPRVPSQQPRGTTGGRRVCERTEGRGGVSSPGLNQRCPRINVVRVSPARSTTPTPRRARGSSTHLR